MAQATLIRSNSADLTGSRVFASSVQLRGLDRHEIVIKYQPDEADGRLDLIAQISHNDDNTADASSDWIQVGAVANSSGTLTFTAQELQLAAAGAGTDTFAHWSFDAQAYKMRIGVLETFTAGGSNFGNVVIWLFNKSS